MAGDIRAKERAIVTLTGAGASIATGSAAFAGSNLDARSGGNAPDDLQAQFELTCQFSTVTGMGAGTIIAELYLLPILDGTNAPDVDLTASTSRLPYAAYVGAFEATKAPTASTAARFVSGAVPLNPLLYAPYIINRSGQTMSSNWSLKFVSVQGQYT